MKPLLSIVLFLTFAARPVYNVGFILYYELNLDYIVANYCVNKDKPELKCNGKCYLMQHLQLKEASKKQEKDSEKARLVEAFYPLYFHVASQPLPKVFFVTILEHQWKFQLHPTHPYLEKVTQPPKERLLFNS